MRDQHAASGSPWERNHTHQWSPVRVDVAHLEGGEELRQRHDQEEQVQEHLELLIEHLKQALRSVTKAFDGPRSDSPSSFRTRRY